MPRINEKILYLLFILVLHTVLNLYISLSRTCVFKKISRILSAYRIPVGHLAVAQAASNPKKMGNYVFDHYVVIQTKHIDSKKSPCYIAGALIYYLVLDHD